MRYGPVSIEDRVFALVVVRQQAVVASRFTALLAAFGVIEIGAIEIKMQDAEGLSGNSAQGSGFVDEASENASAALLRFVIQDPRASLRVGEWLGGQLTIIHLIQRFDPTFERILQAGKRRHVNRLIELKDQCVSTILDVRNDACLARRLGQVAVSATGRRCADLVVAARPFTGIEVQGEAKLLLPLAAAPPEIDAPQGCRGRIDGGCQRFSL